MKDNLPIGVLGAGPKGIALAAKARVLRELGCKLPPILLLEKSGPGAAWSGKIGYTDGLQPLGTSPEKDLGFPYRARYSNPKLDAKGSQIDAAMQRFSWQAYQVYAGRFQTWIDRGRPAPLHQEWAGYLRWVHDWLVRTGDLTVLNGDVSKFSIEEGCWRVSLKEKPEEKILLQALVITGTGERKNTIKIDGAVSDRVLDGQTFWSRLDDFARGDPKRRTEVTIIGSGETAGSVAAALAKLNTRITIISKDGFIFSRGETFQENALYSSPDEWPHFSEKFRREFIARTDRGVFSQKVKSDVDNCDRIGYVAGRVGYLYKDPNQEQQIVYTVGSKTRNRPFDWVVIATGFDSMSFRELLDESAKAQLHKVVGEISHETLAQNIGPDLSVTGYDPPLHLPMLAGLAQGPGFPNLSCLGTLSDRILDSYVEFGANEPEAVILTE